MFGCYFPHHDNLLFSEHLITHFSIASATDIIKQIVKKYNLFLFESLGTGQKTKFNKEML